MSDVERLRSWFSTGELIRPDADVPNTVDLASALSIVGGMPQQGVVTPGTKAISEHIGESEHVVLVLVDGFGANLLERLPDNSLFRANVAMELQTVFPSSTAPCLTSLATGLWPAEHGVPGWFMYVEPQGRSIAVLPFAERGTEADVRTLGVSGDDVFTAPVRARDFTRPTSWMMPQHLVGSVYTDYSSGGATQAGYRTLDDAVRQIELILARAETATYTYWYVPDVDFTEHVRGASHAEVARVLRRVERAVEALAKRLDGNNTRIIVTADHGQIDIPRAQLHLLAADDSLMRHLVAPPSCEPRVPAFHVRPGGNDAFAADFRQRFGETWVLLTVDEVDELRLFGPEALSRLTRSRLGNFVALNNTHEIMMTPSKSAPLRGSHGGLLPDEMLVPLIIV